MTIAVADSWEGRSTSATLGVTIPADTIQVGDLIVVFTFCAGSGAAGAVTDDAGNVYTEQEVTPPSGTFTTNVTVSDALCEVPPTQVNVSNDAGGGNDVAGVVLRITHDGTGWLDKGSPAVDQSSADDPVTNSSGVAGSGADSFAGPGSAVFLAAVTHDGATTTLAPQATWTEAEEEEDASTGIPYSVVYKVYTEQPGAVTHTWTTGAARDYSNIILGYTENIADLLEAVVSVAPSPAITGLTVEAPTAGLLPDPDVYTYHVLIGPPDAVPDFFNSELVRVIGRTGTVLDIERAQFDTRAHAIDVDWRIWFDHLYSNFNAPGLMTEVSGTVLKQALSTIPWP